MTAAEDNKGAPARSEADHLATNAPGLPAAPPKPSPPALPAAFRRTLAGGSAKGGLVPQPLKGARALAAQAKETKPGAARDRPLGHANTGPRSGHK